jgi:hypothetical protein
MEVFAGVTEIVVSVPRATDVAVGEAAPPAPQPASIITTSAPQRIGNIFLELLIRKPSTFLKQKKPPAMDLWRPGGHGIKRFVSPVALRPKVSPGLL